MKKIAIFLAVLTTPFLIVSCGDKKMSKHGPQIVMTTWDSKSKMPKWYLSPPDGDNGLVYFVGMSSSHESDEGQAFITAKLDASKTVAEQINTKVRSLVTSAKVTSGVGADQDVEKVTKYVVGNLVDNLNLSGLIEKEKAYAQYEENKDGEVLVTYVGFSKMGMEKTVYDKQLKMALEGFKKSGPEANPAANKLVDETMKKLEGGE